MRSLPQWVEWGSDQPDSEPTSLPFSVQLLLQEYVHKREKFRTDSQTFMSHSSLAGIEALFPLQFSFFFFLPKTVFLLIFSQSRNRNIETM